MLTFFPQQVSEHKIIWKKLKPSSIHVSPCCHAPAGSCSRLNGAGVGAGGFEAKPRAIELEEFSVGFLHSMAVCASDQREEYGEVAELNRSV